ncbi:MAG TPA: cytochrome c oxidase assembly protein [Gemmatimonadales bacterium]|nr:cytochrome c oxidase assembly protein [Gemmatimonadales bacterium]
MSWWCSATGDPWTWAWRAYPGVWLFVLGLAGLYVRFAWQRDPAPSEAWRRPVGGLGLLLAWGMLDWPVGPLGAGYFASIHAAQFLVLAFIVPPVLLVGVDPRRWARLAASPARRALQVPTHPLIAAAGFNLVVLVTHVPGVVDRAMASQLGAFAIDAAWLASGLWFWWPIVAPVPARRGGALARIGYLFAGSLIHTGLGMWLLLSPRPVYGVYELAPPVAGRSPMADQAMAGGLMELVGGLIILAAIAVLFFSWARAEADDRRPAPRPGGVGRLEQADRRPSA